MKELTPEQAAGAGLRQGVRVALVAAVGNLWIAFQAGGKIDWRTVALGAAVAAYEGFSKYVNENPDIPWGGLYPKFINLIGRK